MDEKELLLKLKAIDELSPVLVKATQAIEQQTTRVADAMEKMSGGARAGKKDTEGLNVGLMNLTAGFGLVKMGIDAAMAVWGKMSATINKSIEEAEQAVQATNKLNSALVVNGMYTEQNIKSLDAYIKKTAEKAGVDDDQVKKMVAQGIQMGLNIDQAQKMEEATRKLAVAMGVDAEQAFTVMQASLNGQTRGLARVLPQVKDLTAAQLKNGEAAALVNKHLTDQYQMYEKSFSASLKRANTAIDNVYEALGKMITQNPMVTRGIQMFVDLMKQLEEGIQEASLWIEANQEVLGRLGEALFKVGKMIFDMLEVALKPIIILFREMPGVMTAVTIAFVAMTGPIGLTVAAVAALTAAFAKWPGLFDMIVGVYKQMVGFILDRISVLVKAMGSFVSLFSDDFGQKIKNVSKSLEDYAGEIGMAGEKQRILGQETKAAADITFKSAEAVKKETVEIDKNMVAKSALNAKHKELADSYAGIVLGSKKYQAALQADVQTRDQDLKKFEEYLAAKQRLAVTKEMEQQQQLAKFRSGAVGETGGAESTKAKAAAEIAAEQNKQFQLIELRKQGVITQAQLSEEIFESNQKIRQQELIAEQAHQQQLADIMGTGPAGYEAQKLIRQQNFDQQLADDTAQMERLGATQEQMDMMKAERMSAHRAAEREALIAHNEQVFQISTEAQRRKMEALGETPQALEMKKQMATQEFQMKLQQKMMDAQQEEMTDTEIRAMKEQAELEHKVRLTDIEVQYWENQAQLQEKAGNDWEAFQARRQAQVAQHGAIMGNLQAIQNSTFFKAENQMMSDLSSLRTSKSKTQFEIGKKAAIAQAITQTFLGAVQAFTSLSPIPIVGPALGAAAAAAAIAAGMNNVNQIRSQQFGGGQADEGMDSIPQALSGKSFVLSGGERVVQPSANKDLKNFLDREKMASQEGGGRAGGGINITLHYNGSGGREDAKKMADIVIEEIRTRSERGSPIMSSKGIVNG